MAHEHVEIGDVEFAEMLSKMQDRWEAAVEATCRLDAKACARCLKIGALVGQIVNVEMVLDGHDYPELHAALQAMYAKRDQLVGHRPDPKVIQ